MTKSPKPSARDLSPHRCMDLSRGFHRVRAEMVRHAEDWAAKAGMEAAHLGMLHVLGLRGPTRMSDLAKRTVIASPTLTRRAQQLETMGLARRERSETSNREVLLMLTDAGVRAFEESFRYIHDEHEKYFDDRLKPNEQRQLLALLGRLV
jgi:DNA-binding MarR family transcriptional regulator